MANRQRQIIALGGGGFSMEPENPTIDLYILEQAQHSKPKVCFLPTASGDSNRYVVNFYAAFSQLDCHLSHLALFKRTPDIRSYLLDQDVIYVGGGNTKSMLALWKEWDIIDVLREAWDKGVVLTGISAGAICWFQQGITDSFAGNLQTLDCLGFLTGSCCPHYDGEAERRPAYHELLLGGKILPGYAIDDGAALHFAGEELHRIVASRPKAHAYRVQLVNDRVEEQTLAAEYLDKR